LVDPLAVPLFGIEPAAASSLPETGSFAGELVAPSEIAVVVMSCLSIDVMCIGL
jgi:hypothetical protein